jgi:hypothetical protein
MRERWPRKTEEMLGRILARVSSGKAFVQPKPHVRMEARRRKNADEISASNGLGSGLISQKLIRL